MPSVKPADASPLPDAPRPIWLLAEPQPLAHLLETQPWVLRDGPERIESGWWDGADVRRDYFIADTPAGETVWIYRDHRYGDRRRRVVPARAVRVIAIARLQRDALRAPTRNSSKTRSTFGSFATYRTSAARCAELRTHPSSVAHFLDVVTQTDVSAKRRSADDRRSHLFVELGVALVGAARLAGAFHRARVPRSIARALPPRLFQRQEPWLRPLGKQRIRPSPARTDRAGRVRRRRAAGAASTCREQNRPSDPRVPLVALVLPVAALAAGDLGELDDEFDRRDVLRVLVAQLPLDAQPQRRAVGHRQRRVVQVVGEDRLRVARVVEVDALVVEIACRPSPSDRRNRTSRSAPRASA